MEGVTWQESLRVALGAKRGPWPTAPKEVRSSVTSLIREMNSASWEEDPELKGGTRPADTLLPVLRGPALSSPLVAVCW